MLLRNESRVKHSIYIKLVYDDNKVRELELNEGDFIQISYRKNGYVKCGVGTIRKIETELHSNKFPFCKRETAVITLDMSEDFTSCVAKINMFDIMDVRHVSKPNETNTDVLSDSDFEVTGSKGNIGCPITEKGVVIHD